MVFKLKIFLRGNTHHIGDSSKSNSLGNSSSSNATAGSTRRRLRTSINKAEPVEEVSQEEPPTLLSRIGGSQVLHNIVELFYDLVLADENLMAFFEGVSMEILSLHQKRFLSMAFTRVPKGTYLETIIKGHHKNLFAKGLNETHFDRVVQHLAAAMQAYDLSDSQILEAVAILAPLRKVFREGAEECREPGQHDIELASNNKASQLVATTGLCG